jgi:hypothetical protein
MDGDIIPAAFRQSFVYQGAPGFFRGLRTLQYFFVAAPASISA